MNVLAGNMTIEVQDLFSIIIYWTGEINLTKNITEQMKVYHPEIKIQECHQ